MEGRHERSAVYEIRRGQRNEGTANRECRAEELVDGAYAFGDEKTVSLPRVTALQVTGYAEHAHAMGT
jgi:hypothetical protein